jgi:protein O-GlcNAc transferase
MDPNPSDQALTQAIEQHQAGRLAQAEQLYRAILVQQPQHAGALHQLGLLAHQCGRKDDAVALIRQAIQAQPLYPAALTNLSVILRELGRTDEAIDAARQALALDNDLPQAHNNLGCALRDKGLLDDAIAEFRYAAAFDPNLAEAHANLGNALRDKGRWSAAAASLGRAVAINPAFTNASCDLSRALCVCGMFDQAAEVCRAAAARNPAHPAVYLHLGTALVGQGRLDEAAAAFRHVLTLNPRDAQAYCNLGSLLNRQGLHDDAAIAFRKALELDPAFSQVHSNLLVSMLYNPSCDAHAIAEEHRSWHRQHAAPLAAQIRPHPSDRSPDRPLRLGFVSPDFRDHVIGRNMLPLFRHLDQSQYQAVCYADVPVPDALTEEFRRRSSLFRITAALNNAALTDQVRSDHIDILVDLTLHLSNGRPLVFARKPAPVQATFAGYPGTTGLPTIDYRLSDPYLDPPDQPAGESLYSEKTLRLPHTFWCYDPLDDHPPTVSALPALTSGHLTFACLNNFSKINPSTLALWARVLNAIRGSRLLLLADQGSHRDRTLRLLADHGIPAPRITFLDKRPHAQYLQLYHQIDLSLDTLPYNGHTTSLDSLFMGVPVITLVGSTVVGRAGLSQLTNLGLPELITHTPDQYVAVIRDWATNLDRLAALRADLRPRMQRSPLMDAPAFARALESAFRDMWRRWCLQP